MKRYTVGFAFTDDRQGVVLIEKRRPEWAVGKLFPVGGHIEQRETALEAMHREFHEEAGLMALPWKHYVAVEGDGWIMDCFRCFSDDSRHARTMTDETVGLYSIPLALAQLVRDKDAEHRLFHDSGWLLLLALDTFTKVRAVIKLGNTEG